MSKLSLTVFELTFSEETVRKLRTIDAMETGA